VLLKTKKERKEKKTKEKLLADETPT